LILFDLTPSIALFDIDHLDNPKSIARKNAMQPLGIFHTDPHAFLAISPENWTISPMLDTNLVYVAIGLQSAGFAIIFDLNQRNHIIRSDVQAIASHLNGASGLSARQAILEADRTAPVEMLNRAAP
jgi:hypothetical protein